MSAEQPRREPDEDQQQRSEHDAFGGENRQRRPAGGTHRPGDGRVTQLALGAFEEQRVVRAGHRSTTHRQARIAAERTRWGYRFIHNRLRREGIPENRKREQRLYRYEGLAVTRWRADGTRDDTGQFCYVKDLASGRVWSAAHQPVCAPADWYHAFLAT